MCKFFLSISISLAAVCCLWMSPESTGNACLDPGIRHTNGMRIASSEPHRSSSVNWTCNPDKLGYCGGVYYRPAADSMRGGSLKRAHHGCYGPPCEQYQSHACGTRSHGRVGVGDDGLEPIGLAVLGAIPNELVGAGEPTPPPRGIGP